MIRTIILVIFLFISLIISLPFMLAVEIYKRTGKPDKVNNFVFKIVSFWARSIVWMSGSHIEVIGLENIPKDEPVVFISNHQGDFDIPIFMGYLGKSLGFISKIEVKKIPVIRKWMEYMQCVFMDRSSLKKSAEAIIEGVRVLKKGQSLVIFPEGTRSRCDDMKEFKAGSFKLATKAGVPIVPISISHSYKIMEERGIGKFPFITATKVKVIAAPPVETKNLSREDAGLLADKVRDIIQKNLDTIK